MDSNPFHVPDGVVPEGFAYRWCAKWVMGERNPGYALMIADGWRPIRYAPLSARLPVSYRDRDGNVGYGGQVLLVRADQTTSAKSAARD